MQFESDLLHIRFESDMLYMHLHNEHLYRLSKSAKIQEQRTLPYPGAWLESQSLPFC
jgi:hypothetical protein